MTEPARRSRTGSGCGVVSMRKKVAKKPAKKSANKPAKSKQERREYQRAWRAANKEKVREYKRAWDVANEEMLRDYKRAWAAANKDKVRENHRAWVAANKESHREYKRAWAAANQDELNARARQRYAADPEYRQRQIDQKRRSLLKREYGLTLEDVEQMRAEQGGRCGICRRKRPLCVDHSHATLDVRGLLCRTCNIGLGAFNDNPEFLRAAAAWLEKPPWKPRRS